MIIIEQKTKCQVLVKKQAGFVTLTLREEQDNVAKNCFANLAWLCLVRTRHDVIDCFGCPTEKLKTAIKVFDAFGSPFEFSPPID